MIGAVIRRSMVDLWDNAVAIFGLNLLFFAVLSGLLFAVSLARVLDAGLVVAALIVATSAGLALMSALAKLVELIAERADIEPGQLLPDLAFCFLAAPALCGLCFIGVALTGLETENHAMSLAMSIGAIWLFALAVQAVVLVPALAMERDRTAPEKLLWLLALLLRYPLRCTVLALVSVVSMVATVGLLPGPAGAAYLFLRAGRLMMAGFDPARQEAQLSAGGWADLLAAETRSLKNRTPRNLLQPWRPAS